jgi:hypothetical protein
MMSVRAAGGCGSRICRLSDVVPKMADVVEFSVSQASGLIGRAHFLCYTACDQETWALPSVCLDSRRTAARLLRFALEDDMSELHVVTGAFGYSGKYITTRLLDAGHRVRTLTNSVQRANPFGDKVAAQPFNFDNPAALIESLRDASVLYNTYWIRFNYRCSEKDC